MILTIGIFIRRQTLDFHENLKQYFLSIFRVKMSVHKLFDGKRKCNAEWGAFIRRNFSLKFLMCGMCDIVFKHSSDVVNEVLLGNR